MKLFAVVVLALASLPVFLHRSSSGRPARYPTLNYSTGIPALSAALITGRARVEVPAAVNPAHPSNRGFIASTVLIPTAARGTSHHAITSIANATFHLDFIQTQTSYIDIRQWLQVNSVIGGAIAVCEYLLFLAVGLAFLQKQIIHGLPPQSDLVVVPVPVGPAGPVVECRVPDTRTQVLSATLPRRHLVRRPLLKSSISRLGGPHNKIEPQPATTPVQRPRLGSWIERMSVEGKLVLYSHHTGPDSSLKGTVQFLPCREHWYYLSQYPARPSLNPLLELLLTFRPFVVKIPGAIMKEIRNYISSTSVVEPEVDATSAPLPPSRSETPDAQTSTDTTEPPTTLNTIRPDSFSQALVASGPSDTVTANTNLIDANLVHIPPPTPPPQKPKPSSSLRSRRANPTKASPRPLPQHIYSAGRPSIATQHLSVTCITAPEPPLSPEQAAEILLNLQPQLVDLTGRAQQRHALRHVADSGMELEKEDGDNIAEAANPVGEDDIPGEDIITEEAKSKFRPGGKRNTARKQRLQMQDGIVGRDDFMQKDTADTETGWVKANSVTPADPAPAPGELDSTSNLPISHANRPTFPHPLSQELYSASRATIATQPLYVTCNTVPAPQLIAGENDVMEEVKFKFRYGEKSNTLRKHGRQIQARIKGIPSPVFPPTKTPFASILSSTSNAY